MQSHPYWHQSKDSWVKILPHNGTHSTDDLMEAWRTKWVAIGNRNCCDNGLHRGTTVQVTYPDEVAFVGVDWLPIPCDDDIRPKHPNWTRHYLHDLDEVAFLGVDWLPIPCDDNIRPKHPNRTRHYFTIQMKTQFSVVLCKTLTICQQGQ